MSMSIHAIYENGVLRPTESVGLPEGCEVEVELRSVPTDPEKPSLQAVYSILDKRFDSREHDIAARHDEHQP